MKRFLAAGLIALVMLGAVGAVQRYLTEELRVRLTRVVHRAGQQEDPGDQYTLRITPSFDAVEDPFAIRLDEDQDAPRLRIHHQGVLLAQHAEDLHAGQPLLFTNLLLHGAAVALHVEATPAPGEAERPCALRIQLMQQGVVFDEATLWSAGDGRPLSGEVRLSLRPGRKASS